MSNTMKNKFGKFLQELFSRGVYSNQFQEYRKTHNIRRIQSQNLNTSGLVFSVFFTQSIEARC